MSTLFSCHTGQTPLSTRWFVAFAVAAAFPLLGIQQCETEVDEDGDEWTVEDGDCNDSDPEIYPGAQEKCDLVDDDCDELLNACSSDFYLGDPSEDLSQFTFEGNSGCVNAGQTSSGILVSCADNNDSTYWFRPGFNAESSAFLYLEVNSANWNDGAPRIGIDFGTGFTAWGPTEGYAFYHSDPLDSAQTGCSSDTCPSMMKNGSSILSLSEAQTAPANYILMAYLLPDYIYYEVYGPEGTVASFEVAEPVNFTGDIGMHCSEADCYFSYLWVELI